MTSYQCQEGRESDPGRNTAVDVACLQSQGSQGLFLLEWVAEQVTAKALPTQGLRF
jgi:hypothetical protein